MNPDASGIHPLPNPTLERAISHPIVRTVFSGLVAVALALTLYILAGVKDEIGELAAENRVLRSDVAEMVTWRAVHDAKHVATDVVLARHNAREARHDARMAAWDDLPECKDVPR